MNYFPFHLGDYAAHTAHLEPMEDLAYRRMLDAYYLREGALPLDVNEVARIIRLKENLREVEAVLHEFFKLTQSGWAHDRCDDEIAKMLDKQAKAKASAYISASVRKANAERTLSERSTDVKLPTPTPTPTPITKDINTTPRKSAACTKPDDVDQKIWDDFLALRKANRSPLTQTALDGIEREARKAGLHISQVLAMCCERGWRGFKADWAANKPQGESFRERDERRAMDNYEEITGKVHPNRLKNPAQVIDVTPQLLVGGKL